jgi:hypothetical protein
MKVKIEGFVVACTKNRSLKGIGMSFIKRMGMSFILVCGAAIVADASSFEQLRESLAELNGLQPISADLSVVFARSTQSKEQVTQTQGEAMLGLMQNSTGISVQYSPETLASLNQEQQENPNQSENTTPIKSTLNAAPIDSLASSLSNAIPLISNLDRATLKNNEQVQYQGATANLLTFEFGTDSLTERQLDSLKSFRSEFKLWLQPNGIPLASESVMSFSGKALVVIKFNIEKTETKTYAVYGDRLIVTNQVTQTKTSGFGDDTDTKVTQALTIRD